MFRMAWGREMWVLSHAWFLVLVWHSLHLSLLSARFVLPKYTSVHITVAICAVDFTRFPENSDCDSLATHIQENKAIWHGSKSRSSFKSVIPLVLTMFYIIIFDVVTSYMHFTIHNPSRFYKKMYKNICLTKKKVVCH